MKTQSQNRRDALKLLCITVLWSTSLLLDIDFALAADAPVNAEAVNALVKRLDAAVQRADWGEVDDVQKNLQRSGSGAVPLLVQRMKQEGITRNVKSYLLDTIRRIPAETTTEALVEISLNDPDPEIARMAGMSIGEQIIRTRLSDEQVNKLMSRIDERSGLVAAHWAYVLARAEHVEKRRLVSPTIARFIEAIREIEGKQGTPNRESYLSQEAGYMLQFLRIFPYLDASVSVPLLKQAMNETKDTSAQKWLLMARGMSGDRAVADKLRQIVESKEEDVSVRADALRAFALALKEDAVSFLQLYENDSTPGPNPGSPPLRVVAKDGLASIRAKK